MAANDKARELGGIASRRTALVTAKSCALRINGVASLTDKAKIKADKKEKEVHKRAQAVCFRLHHEVRA
jgi:hypothetical protein